MAGRPKGSTGSKHTYTIMKGINTAALEKIAAMYSANPELLTPLEIFVKVMNDPATEERTRLFASEKAAPYFHWKMPEGIEISGLDDADSTEPAKQLNLNELTDLLVQKLSSVVGLSPDQLRAAINTASQEKNTNEDPGRSVSGISSIDGSTES